MNTLDSGRECIEQVINDLLTDDIISVENIKSTTMDLTNDWNNIGILVKYKNGMTFLAYIYNYKGSSVWRYFIVIFSSLVSYDNFFSIYTIDEDRLYYVNNSLPSQSIITNNANIFSFKSVWMRLEDVMGEPIVDDLYTYIIDTSCLNIHWKKISDFDQDNYYSGMI